MEHEPDHPPVYHGPATITPMLTEALSALLRLTVDSYNALAVDIARGKLDDEFDSFVDFDHYLSYCVVDVYTDFSRADHRLPAGYRGLAVCYDGLAAVTVPTVDDGRELIELACGRELLLVAEHGRHERMWIPRPRTGPLHAPNHPTNPVGSRPRVHS